MESLLNSLPQILLFGSVLYFYLFSLSLLVIFFIADYYESGYHAFVAFLLFLGINYIWGTLAPWEYFSWGYLGIYLLIGFVYSLVRTYFHGRQPIKYNGYKQNPEPGELDSNIRDQVATRKSQLKENVFRWWFLFPISFIDWVFTDLIKDVYNWMYKHLQTLYETILNLGMNNAERDEIN